MLLLHLPEAMWMTGFCVRDVDGDGHLDVVTRGNGDDGPYGGDGLVVVVSGADSLPGTAGRRGVGDGS